jgi:hypothetical protein
MINPNKDGRKNYYVSSEEVKARLEQMKQKDLEAKEPEYNLIILKTPTGDIKIKTKLTKAEWLKKYKSQAKKKDLQTFNDLEKLNNTEL